MVAVTHCDVLELELGRIWPAMTWDAVPARVRSQWPAGNGSHWPAEVRSQWPAEGRSQWPARIGTQCPLKFGHYDLLKLGHDGFTTIVGEEMGGGNKVAHTGETDFTVVYCIYAHAACHSGAARHPNNLSGWHSKLHNILLPNKDKNMLSWALAKNS